MQSRQDHNKVTFYHTFLLSTLLSSPPAPNTLLFITFFILLTPPAFCLYTFTIAHDAILENNYFYCPCL